MGKPRALVVDNDRFYVELLADLLEKEGYQVLKAYDGLEALELLERELPDLVFLDIIMPKVDGERVCRYLKENPKTRAIPVVILSGLAVEDRAALLEMGADAYVAKGNLKDIQEGLLSVLKRLKAGERAGIEEVWGADRTRPRTLVKEVLAIMRHHEALLRTMREGVLDADARRLIASGGISSIDDLRKLRSLEPRGLIGAIVGKALYEGTIDLTEAINAVGPV